MSDRAYANVQAQQKTLTGLSSKGSLLQRTCACGQHTPAGGECEECRKKREGTLQRAAIGSLSVGIAPPIVHEVLRSPGQPLDAATRAFIEPRFGYDFSGVRVHTDAKAAESAQAVDALAYTVGRNVVFGAGQYAPKSNAGRQLIAHELTHVLQQSNGAVSGQATSGSMGISDPNDSFERQADETASRLFSHATPDTGGNHLHPVPGVASTIQRQATKRARAAVSSSRGVPIVEDGQRVGLGQMQRTEFLTTLRDRLITECEAELVPVGRSATGCPYILRTIERYSTRPLSLLLRLIQGFAHPPVGADAPGLIEAVSRRARAAARRLAASGDQRLQAMTASDTRNLESHDPIAVRAQLGSGGLFSGPVRDQMEQSFGTSFSSVRIHTDATATHLNAELGARAFTIGTDIAFASGQYRPGTLPGDALIAHELAHTLQQGARMPHPTNRATSRELEQQADRAAIAAVAGREGVGSSLQASGQGIHIQRDGVGEVALAIALLTAEVGTEVTVEGGAVVLVSEAAVEAAPLVSEAVPLISEAAPLVSEAAPLVSEAAPLASEAAPLAAETTTAASSSSALSTAATVGVGVAATTLSSDSPTKENTCANTFPNLILCEGLSMDYQFANGYQDAKRKFPQGTKFQNPPRAVDNPEIPCYGKGGTHRLIKNLDGHFLGSLVCCPCCQPTSVGPAEQEQCAYRAKENESDRFYKQNP